MSLEPLTIISIALAIVGLYFLLIFPTQWLKVERIQYPCQLGIRILQISDIHVEKLRIRPNRLKQLIIKEKPDYIFLTGDFTERARYLPKVERYIQAITSQGLPVFAVLGNHDYRLKPDKLNQLVHILEKHNIQLLRNETYTLDDFQIVGIDDLTSKKSKVAKSFKSINPKKPTIVITHDPNTLLQIKRDYTYFMAGHFHGMQFKLPFLYRFVKKGRLAADGIIKGLHNGVHGPYYISQGIGQVSFNARFLIRSEVTIHEL